VASRRLALISGVKEDCPGGDDNDDHGELTTAIWHERPTRHAAIALHNVDQSEKNCE